MQKHFPNINPAVTVVGLESLNPIGLRDQYVVNRLGDEVREPASDGSVIARRPVVAKVVVDFSQVNEEALLTIVRDRLADRVAGEYGTRRVAAALKNLEKALAGVVIDSTKPIRKRPQGEAAAADGDEGEPVDETAAAIQIPGVVAPSAVAEQVG